LGSDVPPVWSQIILHHSAGRGVDAAAWEGIRRFHTAPPPEGRGWQDVGYHFGVGLDARLHGTIFRGRPLTMAGSHCPGHNSTAIGICTLGDFTASPPPAAQLDQLVLLVADLCRRHKIGHMDIHPHRQFRQTECPGRSFPFLEVRERVLRALASAT